MPNFSRLELKNFKSYKDEVCINWMQFSSIIGPNGAGKSSIVDAIEFAFCFPRYDKISIQRLKEDICNKSNIKDNDNSRTWVRLTLNFNGKEIVFQRSVDYNDAIYIYSINNTDVNIKDYKARMLECNINIKANNFLVQQNSIENIAMKGTKERCEFFEHICNSIAYKGEYTSLSKKLHRAHLDIEQLKKDLNFQYKLKKELLKTSKETEKYDKLQRELTKIEFDYYLLKLYQIDKTIDQFIKKQNEAKISINIAEKIRQSKEDALVILKNQFINQESYLKKVDDECENVRVKLSKYSSKMLELIQKNSHCEDSIKKIERNLSKAKNIDKAHEENIKDLKRQYHDIQQSKKNYEKSESQHCSLKLKDEQYEEYLKLKSEAQEKFAKRVVLFYSIERERDSIKTSIDAIDYETRIKLLSEQIKREKSQINQINLDINAINEKIKDKEIMENQIEITNNSVEKELEDLIKEVKYLSVDISSLEKEICDSNISKEENRKFKRKTDVLLKLKANFPGVYDRLKNLNNVREERYQVSVMKILGKNMDNIVVDNRFTAIECMNFLKRTYEGDKFSTFETFLPLDYISRKTIDDTVLRKIKDERNTRLISDVIVTESEEIKRLLCHFYNIENVIVCETDDEASDLSFRKKLNCVSLNGTYYKKDGQFSGGLANLLQQLKQWNYKEYEDLKEKKRMKSNLLQELQKQITEKQKYKDELTVELEAVKRWLETNLRPFIAKHTNELLIKEKRLSELEKELVSLKTNPNIAKLQKKLDDKNNELERMENEKNLIEDRIFARFCDKFHIDNIRQYEHGDLKKYKERIGRKKEYEIHLDKISNEIEYEKSRSTKSTVLNLETQLNELKGVHSNLKENEDKLKTLIDKNKSYLKDNELKSLTQKVEEIRKEIKLEGFQCKSIKRDVEEWNSTISTARVKISNLTFKKHKILMDCKINNINIPLLEGTMDKVLLKLPVDSIITEASESSSRQSSDSQLKENELVIDYIIINNSNKNLNEDELRTEIISLKNKQNAIRAELQLSYPKLKAKENLKSIEENMKILNDNYKKKREKLGIVKKKFNQVKNQRRTKFNEFFNSVAEQIDGIFKNLYKNPAAQACINVENVEEPYLDGIEFSCIIPKKKFVPMQNLSGGEKTMSAVALLLAIYRVKPAPFIIFDEIDAALDNANINKIANHLLQLKSSMQIINISHHELLSSCADTIIGINISPRTNSTYVVHVMLGQYQKKTIISKCIKNTLKEKPLLLKARMENYSMVE